jgi:hypothetical protein
MRLLSELISDEAGGLFLLKNDVTNHLTSSADLAILANLIESRTFFEVFQTASSMALDVSSFTLCCWELRSLRVILENYSYV